MDRQLRPPVFFAEPIDITGPNLPAAGLCEVWHLLLSSSALGDVFWLLREGGESIMRVLMDSLRRSPGSGDVHLVALGRGAQLHSASMLSAGIFPI